MKQARRGRGTHWHFFSYPVSLGERVYSLLLGPLAVVFLVWIFASLLPHGVAYGEGVSLATMLAGSAATLGRLAVAFFLSALCAIPLALLTVRSPALEAILLPVFDVLESVPILAVFPVIVLFFVRSGFLEGAAIALLFLNMLWNIVFALIGGLKIVPKDIEYAARVFGLRGFGRLRRVILPAIFPQFVTGSLLAFAEGWNLIIVVEALHAYIPGGTEAEDLFGIGSILVHASAAGRQETFALAIFVLVVVIATLNFAVWQRLLHYSQRFRFE